MRARIPIAFAANSGRAASRATVLGFALCLSGCMSSTARLVQSDDPDPRTAAELATRSGDWNLAANRWYALFLDDKEQSVKPCIETARALLHIGDGDNASNVLDIGLRAHPDDPDLLELKGEALVKLGFRRAAEEQYRRCLDVDPKRVSALLALGKLQIDLGLEDAAVVWLNKAIAISGGDYETYMLLARAEKGSGDVVGAYKAYQQALILGEGSLEDLSEAAALAANDKVRKTYPDSPQTALRWLERALQRNPQCTKALFSLGVLNEDLGDRDAAIEHYRRAVETDPACLMALTNLAIAYAARGDEAHTREMVDRALQLETDGERRRALQKLLDASDSKQATVKASKNL